ncbi:hypothetical protein ACFP81_03275 [Deinococcus lacus]|uniref:Uncharacterized protein n=1 Tax=Deinococcus lacus TaxID=392561 RepID=A0ABW1YAD0_9DEIO
MTQQVRVLQQAAPWRECPRCRYPMTCRSGLDGIPELSPLALERLWIPLTPAVMVLVLVASAAALTVSERLSSAASGELPEVARVTGAVLLTEALLLAAPVRFLGGFPFLKALWQAARRRHLALALWTLWLIGLIGLRFPALPGEIAVTAQSLDLLSWLGWLGVSIAGVLGYGALPLLATISAYAVQQFRTLRRKRIEVRTAPEDWVCAQCLYSEAAQTGPVQVGKAEL